MGVARADPLVGGLTDADGVFGELEALALPLADDRSSRRRGSTPRRTPSAARVTAEGSDPDGERLMPPSPPPRPQSCEITFESFGVVAELSSDDPDLLTRPRRCCLPAGVAIDG